MTERRVPAARRRAFHRGAAAAAITGGTLAVAAPVASVLVGAPAPVDASVELAATEGRARAVDTARPVTGAALAAAVLPVSYTGEPLAAPATTARAANLVKAADLQAAARRAEEARLAREARVNCAADLSAIGAVKPWVRDAARLLSCLYDQPELIGVAGREGASDHPLGLALDLMTRGAKGDRIAACVLANRRALGVEYVIWKQRINFGSGWEAMEDRGGDTANHYDHVHVSFRPRSGSGTPDPDLCG